MSLKVTSWVWEHSEAAGSELLLLLALADQGNDEGESWPSIRTLCVKTRLHEDTVHRLLRKLVGAGRVARLDRPGRSSVFRVVIHTPNPPAECTPPQIAPPTPPQFAGDVYPHPPAEHTPLPPRKLHPHPPANDPPRTKDLKTKHQTPPPPSETSPADGLALVVVEALPENLGRTITRSVLRAACVPLAAAGWTPETLTQTVHDRPWGDVRAGGVIQWLRGLPAPPQPRTAPPRCPECVDGWLRDERGERSATRCPTCRPRAVAS